MKAAQRTLAEVMARPQINVPLALYRVDGSTVDLDAIATGVNSTWNPAGIRFEVHTDTYNSVGWWPNSGTNPIHALHDLSQVLTDQAKSAPRRNFIRGFYGNWTNGPNGLSFPDHHDWDTPSFAFFVRDYCATKPDGTQTPRLERVTSHELGHLLRLAHYKFPVENLMADGKDGEKLARHEISIARAAARWMLERSSS